MSTASLQQSLLKRQYKKRKAEKLIDLTKKLTKHTTRRTGDDRLAALYHSTRYAIEKYETNDDLWLRLAIENGQKSRGLHPTSSFDTPAPFKAHNGASFSCSRRTLRRFLERGTRFACLDPRLPHLLDFDLENYVVWVKLGEGMAPIFCEIFLHSKENTQFPSFKIWLSHPLTMVSYFDRSPALINGCDNMGDAFLSLMMFLFRLWYKTGIVPSWHHMRSVNLTLSGDTKTPLDLMGLFRVFKPQKAYETHYSKAEPDGPKGDFPGLSIVQKRANILSTKGKSRKLSIELFDRGTHAVVGLKNTSDAYNSTGAVRQLLQQVLVLNAKIGKGEI